eukprot:GILJ01000324.1.p1 GENE.GILJ01000324.1~~GILJ01000324.1.p1  ORF type:complete len:401 (-),score=76.15 GILJ01000324.1:203-1357(-)
MVFWLISVPPLETSREATWAILKDRLFSGRNDYSLGYRFELPEGMKVGTLDGLVSLSDSLVKIDNFVDSVVKKVEKQFVDIDPNAELKCQNKNGDYVNVETYLTTFEWDESRYPYRSKGLQELTEMVQEQVTKMDDDIRAKSQQHNDLKSSLQSAQRKQAGNLLQRDLVEVLTGKVVAPGDFIETEHLSTVVCVVPKTQEREFLSAYEKLEPGNVVPRSAKKFAVEDREGNSVWRVVLFKKAAESFKAKARENKFSARDFTYDPTAAETVIGQRSQLENDVHRSWTSLMRTCKASFSESFIAWTHLKAIRVFCESVLRFGLPVNFVSVLLKPHPRSNKKIKESLFSLYAHINKSGITANTVLEADENEADYYPYVFFEMDVERS